MSTIKKGKYEKNNDPFGFTKAIDLKVIDNLSDEKLDQIAKMFDHP